MEKQDPVVVFPVRSLTNFAAEADGSGIFGSAMLVAPGTPVKQVVHMINHQMVDLFQVRLFIVELPRKVSEGGVRWSDGVDGLYAVCRAPGGRQHKKKGRRGLRLHR